MAFLTRMEKAETLKFLRISSGNLKVAQNLPPLSFDIAYNSVVLRYFGVNKKIIEFINEIQSAQEIILRMESSFRNIVTRDESKMMHEFARIGSFVMLSEQFLIHHPQYSQLIDKLIELGRTFLQFIQIASTATEPAAFDPETDLQSSLAAIDCFAKMETLFGSTELMVDIDNISAGMKAINISMRARRIHHISICYQAVGTI
jgi:hypothetical protein